MIALRCASLQEFGTVKWGRLGFTGLLVQYAFQVLAERNGVPGRCNASSFLLSTVGDAFPYH